MTEYRRATEEHIERRQRNTAYGYYTPGTAAPKVALEPAPRQEQPKRLKRPVVLPEEGIKPGYMIFLIAAFAAVVIVSISMLTIRSGIISTQNTYEAQEEKLQKLRAENDSKEIYLNKSIDLDEVYKVATEELGMVYPSHDQVIYYERTDGGYVRQYEDIPTE